MADCEWYECLSCLNPDLRDGYSTLLSQLLLGLLAGVGVSQVGVEVLVQHLRRLLVEVPSLPSGGKHTARINAERTQHCTEPLCR